MPHNVLVADDDVDTRIILRAVLERVGFSVLEATTADEAIAHAQRAPVDLIIVNYPMPDTDGVTIARRLRSLPAVTRVPILNLTSRVVPQYVEQAAAEGVNLTIPKPIDIEDFIRIVHRFVSATAIPAS